MPILSLVLHSDIGDGDRRVLVARIDSFCVKLRLHRRPAQAAHLRCESETFLGRERERRPIDRHG